MNNDVNILHHIGLISHSLDAMAVQYEFLGFTLTPITLPRIPLRAGDEPQPIGVANRCAIFKNNYLEFLGVVDSALWASITIEQRGPFDIDRPLARYEGLHVLHYGTDNLAAVTRRLDATGIVHQPIRLFQRLIDTPDGLQMMRAQTLSLPPGRMPEALFQIVQHETPELVLQPRYMDHPNGAQAIVDIIICTEDSDDVAARYAAAAGQQVQFDGRIRRIGLGLSDVLVTNLLGLRELLPGVKPPTLPWLAGFTVTADLSVTRSYLDRRGVAYQEVDDCLVILPENACGSAVRFQRLPTA